MFQRGKSARRCLVENRFHQAVVRLLSTKYHMSSSDVVWGGLNGNFQSFVRFHQNADHSGGKQGTQRARLVLGGGELHHTAAHYDTLQHTATHCKSLQHTATHCNSLQHTATHCNTLQHAAIHYHGSPCGVGSTSHIQNPDSLLKLCQSRASAKKGQGACKWMNPEWVMSPVYDSYLQTVHSSIEFMARSISFVHKERMSFFLLFPFLERWAWILTFQESAPGWWSIMNLQVLLKYSLQ